jgi:DNA-binding response OmpR family regulator
MADRLAHYQEIVIPTAPTSAASTVVSRVRRKVEHDPQDPELILTAWGVGYKFVDVD